ncbi:MAG: hypothetical protein IJA77_10925 [Clostridia bacterium]|nr:hypothetical protein [Clostridia bacterium]
MGKLFNVLKWGFHHLSPKMTTTWEEPFIDEPCVFVCNHVGAMGPIQMVVNFPLCDQVKAWCNSGIMDRKFCPDYVRQDYWWEPGCKLEPLYNATIPYIAAAVIPPVLKSAPTIPVYHPPGEKNFSPVTTMRLSIAALNEGKHLVIFPEQPSGYKGHHTWINMEWLYLAVVYHRKTGKALRLYPVHIDTKGHAFHVAKPVMFDPERSLEEQKPELERVLAAGLRGEKLEN